MVILTFKIRELPGTNITSEGATWNYFFKKFVAPLNWEGRNFVAVRISDTDQQGHRNEIEIEGGIRAGSSISIEADPNHITRISNVLTIRGGSIKIKAELSAEEARKQRSQEAKDEIIKNINDNFDLTTDLGNRLFVCPASEEIFSVHQEAILPPDLEAIATAIVNYLTTHPADFSLELFQLENLQRPRGMPRPWYSPLSVPGSNKLTGPAWNTGDEQADRMRYIRKGTGANLRQIFPDFFLPEQYERIKNALGDNVACKVAGCYNNYADTFNHDWRAETTVVGGRCGYHRRTQNNNVIDISDDEYNDGIRNWGYDSPFFARFKELEAQIFGEDPGRFSDQALVNEISNKINETIDQRTTKKVSGDPWRGPEITPADDETTKNNLKNLYKKWIGKNGDGLNNTLLIKKMAVIELMESLLENGNPPPSRFAGSPSAGYPGYQKCPPGGKL